MQLILGSAGSVEGDAALDLAIAAAMARSAAAGRLGPTVRIYRPVSPAVAFGRRDTRAPGFSTAVRAARASGFEPVVRATGGRAVAYTDGALVVDHVEPEGEAGFAQASRFERFGGQFVELFSELGVDARVGSVPGEYCPGEHSVNARGVVKLVGTAQRVVRGGWLFSSLVMVSDAERVRPVLGEVYAALEQEFDVDSVGSLAEEQSGLDVDQVQERLLASYARSYDMVEGDFPEHVLALAHELRPGHVVDS